MFGTIESHMFKEMSQTILFRSFKSRSYFLRNIKISSITRRFIVNDIISQSILKLAELNIWIKW